MIALMLFGIPSMIVASKKGFAESRWLLALGIVGFVVVCCLPSARARDISHSQRGARAHRANKVGAVMCGIGVAVSALAILVSLFVHAATRYY